ncbi:hypothetical protein [Amycolatopsis kentuckyensis]|uniref:hypothetical protein n=1 Tax=Amycolatopsis kentuckyensis TaxID=218823 RepID=UPI001ABFBE41|nr:hypothetical protein [Amycolatopsis kentuckyensis]
MSIFAIITIVLGGLTALGAAWKILKPVFSAVRRLTHFVDDWFGEPDRPGVPGRPGVMARLELMQTDLDKIKHEMWPNSGSSLRDAVDRLEKAANSNE